MGAIVLTLYRQNRQLRFSVDCALDFLGFYVNYVVKNVISVITFGRNDLRNHFCLQDFQHYQDVNTVVSEQSSLTTSFKLV